MLSINNDKLIQANHLKEQKQIEDMAADLHEELETENIPYHECYFMAQRLIKKGWIKPNEGSAVLSSEEWKEYEQFKSFLERNDWESVEHIETTLDKCQKVLYERLQQASKKTVEKLITKIKQSLNNVETIRGDDTNRLQPEIGYNMREVDDLLDELAKQSGLEMEE